MYFVNGLLYRVALYTYLGIVVRSLSLFRELSLEYHWRCEVWGFHYIILCVETRCAMQMDRRFGPFLGGLPDLGFPPRRGLIPTWFGVASRFWGGGSLVDRGSQDGSQVLACSPFCGFFVASSFAFCSALVTTMGEFAVKSGMRAFDGEGLG